MNTRLLRVVIASVVAAVAGATALQLAYLLRPGFSLELDRPMPDTVTGFHGEERAGQDTYAWTRRDVTMPLPGLDRSLAWECTVRLRGGRVDESTLPDVITTVDGVVVGRHTTTNDFSTVTIPVAPGDRRGAMIALTVSNTFVPGPDDRRELGVYVDRWTCGPVGGARPLAPPGALRAAAITSAAFGAVLALMGLPLGLLVAGVATVAGLQAVPLMWDYGPFLAFAVSPAALGGVIAGLLGLVVLAAPRVLDRPISTTGHYVLFVTAAVIYLKLLALAHPGKFIIDAVFHAHRLMWVLDGRYYFTQPMPSGVTFPYAIGLYVFAMPWTMLTTDFVTLLRVIVVAAEGLGGLLVYGLMARYWENRRAGAVAVTLFACVPRTFEIVGNANMTNAFGQSMALVVLAAATAWTLSVVRWRTWIGFTTLLAAALLCHISTFTTLGAILLVLSLLYWFVARPPLRREAVALGASLVAATLVAVVLYYGHFGEAYQSALQVRATPVEVVAGGGAAHTAGLAVKVRDAARLSVMAVGWPITLLAVPGVLLWIRRGWRDRLGMAVAALAVTFAVFMTGFLAAPVDQSFHRYAVEFVSRITLATYPVMVLWAGLGTVWMWDRGLAGRTGAAILLFAAGRIAVMEWTNWFR